MAERKIMKGNEALAEAAIRAGCRFFSGYPITPQTEVLEYLSWRMPEVGGHIIQTEDELTGLHMIMGASLSGARVLSTSAGPGFALFHEGISYLCANGAPSVLVDVQRIGNGCGDITVSQGDYEEVTHGGGNGDSQCIVLTPASVQELVDLMMLAYDLTEKYRFPVILLSDAIIGQMMEGVTLPDYVNHDINKYSWAFKPLKDGEEKIVKLGNEQLPAEYPVYLTGQIKKIQENEQRWESVQVSDADVVCVAYGISSRVCKDAVKKARAKGIKLGLIRLITAWPFPEKAFCELSPDCKGLLAVEMSIKGQTVQDIKLATKCKLPVYGYFDFLNVPDADNVIKMAENVIAGTAKEV